jgi:hypothetical protein
MITTKTLAVGSWLAMLTWLFLGVISGRLMETITFEIVAFFLAIASIIVSVYCLVRTRVEGRHAIFRHAIAGLIINSLLLCIWIPNFLTARERARRPRLDVYVQQDGTILMNEKPATLDALHAELKTLAAHHGVVRYSRANPEGDPPPNAMAVIKAIADEHLPVQMINGPAR